MCECNDNVASATHEEICDQALEHYDSLAKEGSHWNSTVPRAIEFYKQHGPEIPTIEELADTTCPECGEDMEYREHSYSDDYSEYREHYSCTCASQPGRRITFKLAINELEP